MCCGFDGTLFHRHAVCAAQFHQISMPKAIAVMAGAGGMPEARLCMEGCLWPAATPKFPKCSADTVWQRGDGTVSGTAYLDGSVYAAEWEEAADDSGNGQDW